MASTVIKVVGTNSGKSVTATITDVNPNATNQNLATLGTMFTALTTNTYEKTDKITTVNCDTEPD